MARIHTTTRFDLNTRATGEVCTITANPSQISPSVRHINHKAMTALHEVINVKTNPRHHGAATARLLPVPRTTGTGIRNFPPVQAKLPFHSAIPPQRERHLPSPASAVAPSAPATPETEPQSVAEWASQKLNFHSSPKQAEVLNAEAKYLMLCCNRQWGKTTTMAVKTLHAALHTPKTRIVIIARSKEQAGILIENATEFAMVLGLPIRRVLGQSFSLKLPNESRICAVPHTQDTSLGRTANILVVDEAAAVKDAVYYSVSPFVARTHGQIWLLSTPTRQTGFFYEFWHDEKQRWHRVFSTVEECPDIDKEFLEMQREADPTRYRQDFLCEFIQPANRLVSREFVRSILRKKRD